MIGWLRRTLGSFADPITQVSACERLREATADLPKPRPTVDQHGRPRVGWDKSDGRERMSNQQIRNPWQAAADRILRKGRAA